MTCTVFNQRYVNQPITLPATCSFLSDWFLLSPVEIEIGVETLTDWFDMSRRQVAIADEVIGAMQDLVDMLDARATWSGGMRYQKIKGHEYLVRYYTDDKAGRKLVTSHGRRSPDTDRMLVAFEAGRAAWKTKVRAGADAVEENARLSKALRIGRLPREIHDAIERLNYHDLLSAPDYYDAWYVAGAAAMLAYELDQRIMFAADLVEDGEGPTLDLATCGEPAAEIGRIFQAFPDAGWVDETTVKLKNGLTIRLHQIDEELITCVRWIYASSAVGELPMQSQVIIGRNGRATMAPVLSPAVFLAVESKRVGEIHRRRAQAVRMLFESKCFPNASEAQMAS